VNEARAPDPGHTAKRAALDRSLLSGIVWTGAAKWTTQALSWASTLVLARLLTPRDYGIVGMAMVALGFVQLVSEFGVGTAIVRRRELTPRQIAQIGGFAVALGAFLMFLVIGIAKPLAALQDNEAVGPVTAVLGLSFLLNSFRTVPTALLERDLDFRTLAVVDGLQSLVQITLSFGLAWAGKGYWALVLGQVGARAFGAALVAIARPHRLRVPLPFAPIAAEVKFGGSVVASGLAWYLYSNADFALVGKLLGATALGAYTFGWTLSGIPLEKTNELVQRVSGAVISRTQQDTAGVRRYLLGITEGVSLLTFPLSVGLALVADVFVPVVLGTQWITAIPVLRVLSIAAALRSLDPLLAQLLFATGHARENAKTMILAAVTMPFLFYVGSKWGTIGVAATWLIAYPFVVLWRQVRSALLVTDTRLSLYLMAIWPAASSTAIMAAAVLTVRTATRTLPPALSLALEVGAGAIAYFGALVIGHRDRVLAIRDAVTTARRASAN